MNTAYVNTVVQFEELELRRWLQRERLRHELAARRAAKKRLSTTRTYRNPLRQRPE